MNYSVARNYAHYYILVHARPARPVRPTFSRIREAAAKKENFVKKPLSAVTVGEQL